MPKSRKRGGEKAHRKRVQKRNSNLKNQQNRIKNCFKKK